MCGVRCAVYGVRCMVYDVWCMVCGVWSVREKDTRGYVFEVVVEIINVEAIIIMCVDVQ